MKRWVVFFILTLFCVRWVHGEMGEVESNQGEPVYCKLLQKTYVHPERVYIDESGIYVNLGEDGWVQVQSLIRDEKGLFFYSTPQQ